MIWQFQAHDNGTVTLHLSDLTPDDAEAVLDALLISPELRRAADPVIRSAREMGQLPEATA